MSGSAEKGPVTTLVSFGDFRAAGIRSIGALLGSRGWRVNIVIYKLDYSMADIPTGREEDLLIGLLKDLRSDIVGLSVKTPFVDAAGKITDRIKKESGALVVWGGSHPTVLPEASIARADRICVGEGEYPLLEMVERTAGGEPADRIPNLWSRQNGDIVRNEIRPLLQKEELDLLPFPDHGGEGKFAIHEGAVIREDPLNRALEYYPSASRGCPFSCSYCINGILKGIYRGKGAFVRYRSPERVIGEIIHALERLPRIRRIRFQDEVFPWQKEWIGRFCREYKEKVRIPFLCTFHPNTIDEEVVLMLKDAGLISVGLGLQSPSERVRRFVFNRADSNRRLRESVEMLHRAKLEAFYDIILNNPFETEEDRKEGLEFLLSLPRPLNLVPFSLTFFPGYKLTVKGIENGLVSEKQVRDLASMGYFEMAFDWYTSKRKEDIFWNCLFLLSSRSTFPRSLVRALSRSGFFRKHTGLLILMVKLNRYAELAVIGVRRIARGQLNPASAARVIMSRKFRRAV